MFSSRAKKCAKPLKRRANHQGPGGFVIGVRALLVHAISQDAVSFYQSLGFEPSSLSPLTLLMTLVDVRSALVEAEE